MSAIHHSTFLTGFTDLAAFGDIQFRTYGHYCFNPFKRYIRRCCWFTSVPAQLTKVNVSNNFDDEIHAVFSPYSDYVTDPWFRTIVPEVRPYPGYQARWTRNLGHNLIEELCLCFNDIPMDRLTSQHMDFYTAFTVGADRRVAYDNMIGNVPALVDPYRHACRMGVDITPDCPLPLPSYAINMPLPLFFARSDSEALPMALCPGNEIRILAKTRPLQQILIIDRLEGHYVPRSIGDHSDNSDCCDHSKDWDCHSYSTEHTTHAGGDHADKDCGKKLKVGIKLSQVTDLQAINDVNCLKLTNTQIWAEHILVPNSDRVALSLQGPFESVYNETQCLPPVNLTGPSFKNFPVDLKIRQTVVAVFWGVRNETLEAEWSNYSTHHTEVRCKYGRPRLDFVPPYASNPIGNVVFKYENNDRVNMPADYYTLMQPWFHAPVSNDRIGIHLLSFARDITDSQPNGCSNWGLQRDVFMQLQSSPAYEDRYKTADMYKDTKGGATLRLGAGARQAFPPCHTLYITLFVVSIIVYERAVGVRLNF